MISEKSAIELITYKLSSVAFGNAKGVRVVGDLEQEMCSDF